MPIKECRINCYENFCQDLIHTNFQLMLVWICITPLQCINKQPVANASVQQIILPYILSDSWKLIAISLKLSVNHLDM